MKFPVKFRNRLVMPVHYVLIVEDNLDRQRDWLAFCAKRYGPEGKLVPVVVWNAYQAIGVIQAMEKDRYKGAVAENEELPYSLRWPVWIAIDHDIQIGDGVDLIHELRKIGFEWAILASSGIESNNDRMIAAGANYKLNHKCDDPELPFLLNRLEAAIL